MDAGAVLAGAPPHGAPEACPRRISTPERRWSQCAPASPGGFSSPQPSPRWPSPPASPSPPSRRTRPAPDPDADRQGHLQRAGEGQGPHHQGQDQAVRLRRHRPALRPRGDDRLAQSPGPALGVVQEGTFTLYNASDPKCRPHRYGPGQAFVDRGGGNVHIGSNDTDQPVRVVVTFVIPVGAAPPPAPPTPAPARTRASDLAAGTRH